MMKAGYGFRMWVAAFSALTVMMCSTAMAQINYPSFPSPAGLNLVDRATVTGGRLRVAPGGMHFRGAAWFATKQSVLHGFSTTFRFQFTEPSFEDGFGFGLAFHVQNASATLNVDERGGASAVTVSFTTRYVTAQGTFPNVVAVYRGGTLVYAVSLFPNTINIHDQQVHTARIDYAGGWLTVSVDNEAVVAVDIDLAAAGAMDGEGKAWVGFSARNGDGYHNSDVLSWTFTPFTQPARTLIVLADNPYEGPAVSVSPTDLAGTGNGVSPFVRVYPEGSIVTLGAARVAPDGNEFAKWSNDDVDYSGDPVLTITLNENRIVRAVYESIKSVIWDTGPPNTVIFNNSEVYLGYISGSASGLPQRWSAIPFRVPAGGAVINQLDANWFVVSGSQGVEVRYIIWRRRGLDRPVDGDQVATGVLGPYTAGVDDPRVPGGEDWLHRYSFLNIPLPAGDYYLTIYSHGLGAGNTSGFSQLAWLTGAALQPADVEQDFMWRSRSFPDPGFEVFNPATIQPKSGQDPKDRWNCAFVLYGKLAVLRGNLLLRDYGGDSSTVPISVRLRKQGGDEQTRTIYTDRNGNYALWLEAGTYEVSFKASHWLRVNLTDVTLGVAEERTGANVALTNGDIDGDNEVTLFDFGTLVAAFGSMPGDSNWNPEADLDGDEEVTLFDFGVLVSNFGAIGDD